MKTENNMAVLYHYWNFKNKKVINDFFCPIIYSIKSIRRFNKEIPIYVLCLSKNDWQNYPLELNFKVIQVDSSFRNFNSNFFGSRNLLGRPLDVWEFAQNIDEENIFFVDSDVIFVKNFLPIEYDLSKVSIYLTNLPRMNVTGVNSGVVIYNKTAPLAKKMILDWCNRCKLSIVDLPARKKMIERVGIHSFLNDELVVTSVCDEHEVNHLHKKDNYLLFENPRNPHLYCEFSEARNIHFKADYFSTRNRLGLIQSLKITSEVIEKKSKHSFNHIEDIITLKTKEGIKFC